MINVKFERSRVVGFSDAVFGIAMTLLILEIAAPSISSIKEYGMWRALASRIPNFIGFIISFFVTALYWMDYLKISKFTTHFSIKVIWANIFILFFVVLIPFSTSLYVNGIELVAPFVFYAVNLAMIALMLVLFIERVYKQEKEKNSYPKLYRNWHRAKIINTASIWIVAALISYVSLTIARLLWILIFIIDPIIDWHFKKKIKNTNQ